jgi:putative heme-binding domain-containing protein
MKTITIFLNLALVALAPVHAGPIELRDGDVVAFAGGTDLVRMQKDGRLEAALTKRFPEARPRFRDLAWEGDTVEFQGTVHGRWRRDAFGAWDDQLKRVGATVVIAQFGKMESLAGEAGLAAFVERYGKLLDELGAGGRRLVLLEPRGFEWEIAGNNHLPDYTAAIRRLAEKRELPFLSLAEMKELEESAPADLAAAVREKHRLWYDYWRPANWKCLFGDDGKRVFANAAEGLPSFKQEWETFPGLIAAAEAMVLAGGIPKPEPALARAGSDEADVAKEVASFEVQDGYEVNLFADESMGVANPLSVRWDADGRMFVACSDVYPQIDPGVMPDDKVMLLEDSDGDGKADKSSVFARGLNIPTGMEVGSDGVYVGHNTELLHFDWQGKRRLLLSGFGNGDSHQTINSFTWSPDGELWFGQGDGIESRVETPHGVSSLFQAGVFRLRPETLRIEPLLDDFMGPGNPWGVAFDDFGQSFVVDGAGGISYLTPGSIPVKRRLSLPTIGKPGGYCGVEVLGDGSLATGDYKKNQVTRFRMAEDGGGFKAEFIEPLLRSKHRNFRPIDVKLGPDGAIYVVDWYNPITCHQDDFYRHPERDKTHGRIWRVARKGDTAKQAPALTSAADSMLLDALKSPSRWTRTKAKQVLATRGLKQLPEAVRQWEGRDLLEAVSLAVWCGLEDPGLLERLFASTDPRCRAYAARVAGKWGRFDLLELAAKDGHPRVRMEAVLAAGQIPEARSILIVATAAERPRDPWVEYAFKQAVHHLRSRWPDAFRRGELDFGERQKGLVEILRQPDSKDLLGDIRRMLTGSGLDDAARAALTEALAAAGSGEDLRFALELKPTRTAVLGALAKRGKPDFDVRPAVLAAVMDDDPEIAAAGMDLAASWKVAEAGARALEAASDAAAPASLRANAIRALGALGGADAESRLLEITLRAGDPLQVGALKALFAVSREAAADAALKILLQSEQLPLSRDVFNVVAESAGSPDLLAGRLEIAQVSPEQGERLRAAWIAAGVVHERLAAGIDRAAGVTMAGFEYSQGLVDELVAAARAGDPARGRAIYHSAGVGCAACHRIGDSGGIMGPDLSAVGSGVSAERIVTEVLWPERQVKDGFSLTRLTLKDGSVIQGYPQQSRDEKQLLLRDFATGQTRGIPAGEIVGREELGSLMPPTARNLSRGEQADLLGYLITLQGKPADDPGLEAIFDGKTLSGWHTLPANTANDWVVRDGIIAGAGSQDRQSFLVWREQDLTDFELELKYRLPAGGNTGVEIRAQPDPSGKRTLIGYHADIGHAAIGDAVLGAWDFHFAGREEYSCKRGVRLMIDENGKTSRAAIEDPFVPADIRERDWNQIRVVAKGRNFTFFINGKLASEFTDNAKAGRFDSGGIALQIHDKGMKVEFKDIQLKKLK